MRASRNKTVLDAAKKVESLGVGALPMPVIDGHDLDGIGSESDLAEEASKDQLIAGVRGVSTES